MVFKNRKIDSRKLECIFLMNVRKAFKGLVFRTVRGIMRILVVDDVLSARLYTVSLLQKLGISEIVQAENGSQALTYLRSDNLFDVILMDWKMPVMTGPEAISVLNHQGSRIPIVLMTALNRPDDVEKILKLGIQDYLLKPFTIQFLMNQIQRVTGKELNY